MTGPAVPPPAGAGPYRICFVCTGNICRSPMAEVVLRRLAAGIPAGGGKGGAAPGGAAPGGAGTSIRRRRATLADRLEISSAGTGPWHEGEPMDPRAREALARRGYEDHGHVAHQFDARRVKDLDLVVALDRRHHQTLRSPGRSAPAGGRLVLLRAFDRDAGGATDVPDPYYGDGAEFDRCLSLVEAGCRGLAAALAAALCAPGGTGP